jgi:hypothetical protein
MKTIAKVQVSRLLESDFEEIALFAHEGDACLYADTLDNTRFHAIRVLVLSPYTHHWNVVWFRPRSWNRSRALQLQNA